MAAGVPALQGNFADHCRALRSIGCVCKEVRSLHDLVLVDRLIIPGGESTVIGKLLQESGLAQEINRRRREGRFPVFGTCAGAIVLADEVTGTPVPSLRLIDMCIERNAYGRQLQSFQTDLVLHGHAAPVPVSFIRAPRIVRMGPSVNVLATHGGYPVLVRQGDVLAATFHPEVHEEAVLHRLFMEM